MKFMCLLHDFFLHLMIDLKRKLETQIRTISFSAREGKVAFQDDQSSLMEEQHPAFLESLLVLVKLIGGKRRRRNQLSNIISKS